jgi:hypothetical protein
MSGCVEGASAAARIARGTAQTTGVTIIPLNLVGDDVARAEGEGFDSAAEWRRPHVSFWDHVAPLVRADAGDPAWALREAEPVVVHWFRLAADRYHGESPTISQPRPRDGFGAA